MHLYINVNTFIRTCIYVYVHIHVYLHIHLHMCIYIYMYIGVYILYMYTHICKYVQYIQIYTHIYTCIYVHIYRHTELIYTYSTYIYIPPIQHIHIHLTHIHTRISPQLQKERKVYSLKGLKLNEPEVWFAGVDTSWPEVLVQQSCPLRRPAIGTGRGSGQRGTQEGRGAGRWMRPGGAE